MAFHNVLNNASSTLSAVIGTTDLTMSVVEDVFPAVPFYLTLGANPVTYEIVEVTAKTGLVFTIGRAKDGTTAKTYVIGDLVQLFMVAGLLSELQGEVVSHLADNAKHVINVKDYGAKGDGTTNDIAAFRNAVAATPKGGTLYIPPGTYIWAGSGILTEHLLISKSIRMYGSGFATNIVIGNDTLSTTDAIRFSPTAYEDNYFAYFGNFSISGPSATVKYGRHAIHIDMTDPNKHLSNMTIEKFFTVGMTGHGIHLTNPTGTDSLYTTTIQDCLMYNGIFLERSGDSNNILRNALVIGTVADGAAGIEITTVSGATMTIIEGNNITMQGGAISITGANQVKIRNNQIEQVATYISDKDANIYLKDCDLCEVIGNNINAHGYVSSNIRIAGNSSKNKIEGNYMLAPITNHVFIESTTCIGNVIRKYGRFFNASSVETEYPIISNSGLKTVGVMVPIVLGSATNYDTANFTVASSKKYENGDVKLYGVLTPTAIAAGTVLGTVADGSRPITKNRFLVAGCMSTAAGQSIAILLLSPAGAISVYSMPSDVYRISLDGITFATE